MVEAPHPRAWRIAASALLGWNVLGGVVGGALVVAAVVSLSPSGGGSAFTPGAAPLTVLVVGVAAMLGGVGGLLGGGTLVLARGRRPTRRTLVRGIAAGLAVCALVAGAAILAPIMPDDTRPLAVAIGLAIGAVMLGLAFRSREVHWREGAAASHADGHGTAGDGAAADASSGDDPIRDLVDPPADR